MSLWYCCLTAGKVLIILMTVLSTVGGVIVLVVRGQQISIGSKGCHVTEYVAATRMIHESSTGWLVVKCTGSR